MSASNEQPAGQIIVYQAEDEAPTREGKGGSAGGWDGYRGRMTWIWNLEHTGVQVNFRWWPHRGLSLCECSTGAEDIVQVTQGVLRAVGRDMGR